MPKFKVSRKKRQAARKTVPPMFAAVDPGLSGWAVALFKKYELRPVSVHVEEAPDTSGPWIDRAGLQLKQFRDLLRHYKQVEEVFIEWPEFEPSARGRAAANRGDLGKLYLSASVVAAAGYETGKTVRPIPVSVWKGQLPKKIVAERITDRIGRDAVKELKIVSHGFDAVGIGHYVIGDRDE